MGRSRVSRKRIRPHRPALLLHCAPELLERLAERRVRTGQQTATWIRGLITTSLDAEECPVPRVSAGTGRREISFRLPRMRLKQQRASNEEK